MASLSKYILTLQLLVVTLTLHTVYLFIASPLEWKPHDSRARLSCSSFLPRMVSSTKQDVKHLPNELKN